MASIVRLIYGYTIDRNSLMNFMKSYDFINEKIDNILMLGYEDLSTIMNLQINLPHKIKLYTNIGKFEHNFFFENNVLGIEVASFPFANQYGSYLEIENFKLLSRLQNSLNRILEAFPKIDEIITGDPKIHVIYNFTFF